MPAVPVITDAFDATAREMAELWGLPGFRFVMMPHPLASLTSSTVEARAAALLPPILDLLQQGQPG